MKWFFNWMYKGLKEVESQDREESSAGFPALNMVQRKSKSFNQLKVGLATAKSSSEDNHIHLNQSAMNFRLYPATGGHIVEYSYYNENTDRNTQALHLIPSDADLGDALSKIMTLEALKR